MKSLMKIRLIYEYMDYRKFLNDYYLMKKQEPKGFSYRDFSKLAGINSPNYLKLVIDGSRDLTIDNIFAFARALELGDEETHFFELLIHYNQCQTQTAKSYYHKRITNIRNTKPKHGIKVRNTELLNSWFTMAVIITANNRPIDDFKNWAQFIGITQKELKDAVDTLMAHDMIKIQNKKYFIDEDFFLFRDKKSLSEHQKKYLHSQLLLSFQKFKEYQTGAKFISHTLIINRDKFEDTLNKIFDFLQNLTAEAEEQAPLNQLAQLNLQFFKIGTRQD